MGSSFGMIGEYIDVSVWSLWVGIALAGLGSKSLGMGSMLGSLTLVPDTAVGALSGIYLGLDACSALFAVGAFIYLFRPTVSPKLEEDTQSTLWKLKEEYVKSSASKDGKLELLGDFFGSMGLLIGVIGLCAASVYFLGNKKIEEAKQEEKKAKSEEEEALLADGEAAGETKVVVKSDDVKRSKKAAEKKPAEKKTLWSGVLCIYLICMFGESMGLWFNKLTGPHFKASIEYNHVFSVVDIDANTMHEIKPHSKEDAHFKMTGAFKSLMEITTIGEGDIKLIKTEGLAGGKYKVTVTHSTPDKKAEKEITADEANRKAIYFTESHDTHGEHLKNAGKKFKEMWAPKWNVFMCFTLGNAVGRLSFGLTSDYLATYKILALTKSFYIMFCCALYVILFTLFGSIDNLENNASYVNTLVALIGITYGGIFTMVTAYMKEVCAKNQVGFVLGIALVILAVTTYCGNKFFYEKSILEKVQGIEMKHPSNELVGGNTLKSFCWTAVIGNLIALVISVFVWLQHMQIKKDEIAAAKEVEEAEFTDDSDDENDAK
jgi:hypothetical protein